MIEIRSTDTAEPRDTPPDSVNEAIQRELPPACTDCGCRGAHFCTGKKIIDVFDVYSYKDADD